MAMLNVLLLPQKRSIRVALEAKVAQLIELVLVVGRVIQFVTIAECLQHKTLNCRIFFAW